MGIDAMNPVEVSVGRVGDLAETERAVWRAHQFLGWNRYTENHYLRTPRNCGPEGTEATSWSRKSWRVRYCFSTPYSFGCTTG